MPDSTAECKRIAGSPERVQQKLTPMSSERQRSGLFEPMAAIPRCHGPGSTCSRARSEGAKDRRVMFLDEVSEISDVHLEEPGRLTTAVQAVSGAVKYGAGGGATGLVA